MTVGFPSKWVTGDAPCPGTAPASRGGGAGESCLSSGQAGTWQGARTGQSDGLVVLPQSGLQKFVRQVVSCDDPNNLGQGE